MFRTWILALILCFSFCFSPNITFSANNSNAAPVCITVNGHYIKCDPPAFLHGGYTMIPLRAISDALSADTVLWNEAKSTAYIKKGNTEIQITKNSKIAWVNGKKATLDAKAMIVADRFFVPIRFIAETFLASVNWDKTTYTANISHPNVEVPAHMIGERAYSHDDLYWLSRIVHAESEGEPMLGKVAVANVVLNRVRSPLFDDSVYDVIFDRKYGVQFTPTANGAIYNTPSGDSIIAAKRALFGENHAGKSLYFLNPSISTSFWIVNNRTFYKSIGNHDFYL